MTLARKWLVVDRRADRACHRRPEDVLVLRLPVSALGEVEVSDALVVQPIVIPLRFDAQHLGGAQCVLAASRKVRRRVGPADGVGEISRRQGGDDRLRIVGVDAVHRQGERRVLPPERTDESPEHILTIHGLGYKFAG
jgi:hypothetical protein